MNLSLNRRLNIQLQGYISARHTTYSGKLAKLSLDDPTVRIRPADRWVGYMRVKKGNVRRISVARAGGSIVLTMRGTACGGITSEIAYSAAY